MKIRRRIDDSCIFRFVRKLLIDKNLGLFNKSRVLNWLGVFTNQRISVTFLLLSAICLLYRPLLSATPLNKYEVWFLLLVLSLVTCNKIAIKSSRAILFLIGFIIWGAISAVVASMNGVSMGILLYGIFLSAIFPLFFIAASTYPKKYYKLLPIVAMAVCLPLLLAGLWQLLFGATTPAYWVSKSEDLVTMRIYGWSGNPNNLGAVAMISGLIATFALWIKKRWYFACYAVLAVVVTLFTFSRASWLGWVFAIALVLIIRNWRYVYLLLVSAVCLVIPSIRQRVFSISDARFIRDSSLDGRVWEQDSIIAIFRKNPFWGSGPGTYGNSVASDLISPVYNILPQNGYIATYMVDMQWQQILCQYGIVGVLLIIGFLASYLINMLRKYFQTKDFVYLACAAILSVMLLTGFLENVWFFAPIAAFYGIVLGAGQGYASNE